MAWTCAKPPLLGKRSLFVIVIGKLDYRRDAYWSEPRRILLPSVCSPTGSNWLAGFAYSNLLSCFLFLGDGNAVKRVPPLHSRLRNIFSLVREVVWKPQLQAGWQLKQSWRVWKAPHDSSLRNWSEPQRSTYSLFAPFNTPPHLMRCLSGFLQ